MLHLVGSVSCRQASVYPGADLGHRSHCRSDGAFRRAGSGGDGGNPAAEVTPIYPVAVRGSRLISMAGIDTAMLWCRTERRQERRMNTAAMMPQHRALSALEGRFLYVLITRYQREASTPQGSGFGEAPYLNAEGVPLQRSALYRSASCVSLPKGMLARAEAGQAPSGEALFLPSMEHTSACEESTVFSSVAYAVRKY